MNYYYDPKSFVPTNVYRDNYDEVAEDFLKKYCPEALTMPMAVPIFDIARKKIQLTVIDTEQLSENRDVLGTIAFFDGQVEVYDPGTKGTIAFDVKRGTVLIDCTINHEGRENNTMAHECVHWFIHRNYFSNLRKKAVDSDIAFRCPVRGFNGNDDLSRDEERMENQARGIAPRILMPKITTKIKLQELFAAHSYSTENPNRIAVLTDIVDELAMFFRVSKESAKYRMVDLGFMSYEDSLEIYNYDNNGAFEWDADTHPLTVKSSDRPLTRHINMGNAFYEYSKNEQFRETLQRGRFRYVENAFVIDNEKYVYKNDAGELRLTPYARQHPEECTLIFTYTINLDFGSAGKVPSNMMGLLTRVETSSKKLPKYTHNVQNDLVIENAAAFKEEFEKKYARFAATTKTFSQRAAEHMAAQKWNAAIFAERTQLEPNNYYRIMRNETNHPSVETVLAICIGLQLSSMEREELLALAGHKLQNSPKHFAYSLIFDTYKIMSVHDFNAAYASLEIDSSGKLPLRTA